jgi:hypothetical protein
MITRQTKNTSLIVGNIKPFDTAYAIIDLFTRSSSNNFSTTRRAVFVGRKIEIIYYSFSYISSGRISSLIG